MSLGCRASERVNVEHLRGDAYQRLWARCRASLERTGGAVAGTVGLIGPTDEERHAIGGLLRRPIGPRATLRVSLAQLDVALRAGAAGGSLPEVVEALTGALRDRPEETTLERNVIEVAVEAVRLTTPSADWRDEWLASLWADGTLTRLQRSGALDALTVAGRVLAQLPGDGIGLGVLAASSTGSAKALGPGPLSTLVLRAIAAQGGVSMPRSAHGRRRLWDSAGVVVDQLSSQVVALGFGDATDGEPRRWTLRQLRRSGVPDAGGSLFVVENPAVAELAADVLGPSCPPLVCTDGQPSTACELVLAAASRVRVHNDFDWPGLRMCAATIARHGAEPWRMTASDYVGALRPDLQPLGGRPAPSPWDPGLALAMADAGLGVEEEVVTSSLLDDLVAARRR